MKRILFLALVSMLVLVLALTGCTPKDVVEDPTIPTEDPVVTAKYDNGTYRGIYEDAGEQQVSIQFDVTDDVISNVSFRHLYYRGLDYRRMEEGHQQYPVLLQHNQIRTYLEGKPLSAMHDLYNPGDFIENIDTFSGASIRGSKVFSAMQDGLNRGLYSPAGELNREIGEYADGTYRGIYGDGGEQQVSIQFVVTANKISNVSYRHLAYRGTNYRRLEEGNQLYPVLVQHNQIRTHLEGKPLSAIFDLHTPGDFIGDVDGYTGATIRGNKVFSAIKDGLNRGAYVPAGEISRELGEYADGTYRGIYGDGGELQVSIQFVVTDNVISNVSFRHLYYSGTDYRRLEEGHALYPVLLQHRQIIEYLEAKPLSAIFDLHKPGDFITEVDAFSGASIRGNKIFSAIMDGLNRGLY